MSIKSFLSEQSKQARRRAESQHQNALDMEEQARSLRKSAADNEMMANELERLAAQYPAEETRNPAPWVVGSSGSDDLRGVCTPVSPAGREVQHVDVPAEADDKIRFVRLTKAQCSEEQRAFAVGYEDHGAEPIWAIDWDNLTEQQRVAFADKVCTL